MGASMGALFELWRLASALDKQGLGLQLPARSIGKMVATATLTVAPVAVMLIYMRSLPVLVQAVVAVLVYVGLYLSAARLVGLPELGYWSGSLKRRTR